jgi:hypothetical protein
MARGCKCGSGLPFERCHGDPRNDFAREQALREAEAVPFCFPFVRARGSAAAVFADDVAACYAAEDDVPTTVLDDGVTAVGDRERSRVLRSFAHRHPDRWESMASTAGDRAEAARRLVRGALRVAIAERQAPPRAWLEPFEDGILQRSPLASLGTIFPPQLVWSLGEATAARVAAAPRRRLDRMSAVEEVGYALVCFDHVTRTRTLTARLARELPIDDLPRASRFLADACADVERDVGAAQGAAVALLVAYAQQLAANERVGAG